MPGKEMKLIEKALHADGYYYYIASEAAAATLTPKRKRPHIKISFRFDKGLIREEEQEQAAAAIAKEEIPTPGFALVKESVEDDYTSSMASTFQSKLDATKRKMHDSYQQLANAKKQRRIQVIDPRDLPPPPPQSSSKGGQGTATATATACRKKMIISTTTNRNKTRNFFDERGRPKFMKPSSIF